MPRVKGLIIKLPANRADVFNDYAADNLEFSEPVPYFSHDNSTPLLCFIVESSVLTYISFGHGGQKAGTHLRRINLSSIFPLQFPIPCTELVSAIPANVAKGVASRFEDGGELTDKGLEHIINTLIRIAPETFTILARYTENFEILLNKLPPAVRSNLAIQKEATLTALLVAGQDFDRKVIRNWFPSDKPTSFLDGLTEQRLDESQMIRNDFQHLPGFSVLAGHIKSTAIFLSPSEKLTVIYADKEPLEKLTGADLIYYNESYNSFIFVQYKALDDGEYRPDKQLDVEIQRIEKLLSQTGGSQTQKCIDFRLHSNPFFLKLCPRMDFEPESSSLTKGMYIPLEYWKVLVSSGQLSGTRGGQVVSFDNVGRYITNTDFAVLVAKAWVGSTPAQSAILAPMIKETLGAGRAALYAFKRKL